MARISLLVALCFLAVGARADEHADDTATGAKPGAWSVVTDHRARIGGNIVSYQATAGTMEMKNSEGDVIGLMGYTAYVADTDDPERPILFAYNGGPGSASVWLHMGTLGPQRAVVTDAGFTDNGPYERVENEFSILDVADLVMIDPVGTGYGRLVGEGKGEDFWGVDPDIRSVSEFIVQYVNDSKRWASPKYVLGESYGGMRTGGVAWKLLSQHNIALNGVILVSPFMEMVTGFAGAGIDLPHVLFLPTMAATARYHGALSPTPEDLEAFMAEVREFALTEYAPALLTGSRLNDARRAEIVRKLSAYTGLSEDYWDRANLRIGESQFNQELMRTTGKTVGRIDSRFAGNMINRIGEHMDYDPMTRAIGPGYTAAFMDYYQNDLGVQRDETYKVSGGLFGQWDWGHVQPNSNGFKVPFPNTSIDLAYTMQQNPSMRVLVQQGYYDLATPHLATEYYIDHLDIAEELRDNIDFEYYEAGHMMYVHEPSMVKYKQDLARFIAGE
ncbi:MAG: hypothetical protein QNJ00_03550 [Woeseiaceae bacterium]|nr:hypothetical protein [Woeseiaceae bacterium]